MIWLIILGVLIIATVLILVFLYDVEFAGLCGALAVICFFTGMWSTVGGYDKAVVAEEYNLIPIIDESNIYVIETEKGTKIYKCKENNQYDDNIEQFVIKEKRSDIKIEYAKEYTKPVLRKYVQKPTESIWNGKYCKNREYYVLFTTEECVMK